MFFFRGFPRWPVIIVAAGQATLHFGFGAETGRRSAHLENNILVLDDIRTFVDSGDESAEPVGFASTRPGMRSVEG